jgi:DNA-directed RNA polymerase
LAGCILVPLLDQIMRGWSDKDDKAAVLQTFKERVGKSLRDTLADRKLFETEPPKGKKRSGRAARKKFWDPAWTPPLLVDAGNWLFDEAMDQSYFAWDENGLPKIADDWRDRMDDLGDELLRRFPVFLPHKSLPPAWTGWEQKFEGQSATFVLDRHPETQAAITEAFRLHREFIATNDTSFEGVNNRRLAVGERRTLKSFADFDPQHNGSGRDFEHARGVNALRLPALRIDTRMLELVEKLSPRLIDDKYDEKRRKTEEQLNQPKLTAAQRKRLKGRLWQIEKQRKAAKQQLDVDLRDAKYAAQSNQPFHLSYHCDNRGRVYATQHLHYGREDCIRSLFKYDKGKPLCSREGSPGITPLDVLKIHCANEEGSTDKKTWDERIEWANKHRHDIIEKIADNPEAEDAIEIWKKADKPFRFVAACIELAEAWKAPITFVTTLPVAFDGSANGIQHLALMGRDADAAKLVGLIDQEAPADVYGQVVSKVEKAVRGFDSAVSRLKQPADDPKAKAKIEKLKAIQKWWDDEFRRIGKRNIRKLIKTPAMTLFYGSNKHGMGGEISDVYFDLFDERLGEKKPGAAQFLAVEIVRVCEELLPGPTKRMNWLREVASILATQNLPMIWDTLTGFPVRIYHQKPKTTRVRLVFAGRRIEHHVADGYHEGIVLKDAMNASSPNLVHSQDASHLIMVVNEAIEEGIDILVVHDSFSCLATNATRVSVIIGEKMRLMYECWDPLARLYDMNKSDKIKLPLPPPQGDLDLAEVVKSEYKFS